MEAMFSWMSRVFFLGAFVLLGLAILERVANMVGYTFSPTYQSGRLLEFAAVMLVFVIAIKLREIRDGLSTKKT